MLNVGWFVGEIGQGDFIIVSMEAYVVNPSGVGKAVEPIFVGHGGSIMHTLEATPNFAIFHFDKTILTWFAGSCRLDAISVMG